MPSGTNHYMVTLKCGPENALETFWVTSISRDGAIRQAKRYARKPCDVVEVTRMSAVAWQAHQSGTHAARRH